MPARPPGPAVEVANLDAKEQTDALLKTLTPREERVIKMRYGIGDESDHTIEEVGQSFQVTGAGRKLLFPAADEPAPDVHPAAPPFAAGRSRALKKEKFLSPTSATEPQVTRDRHSSWETRPDETQQPALGCIALSTAVEVCMAL